jgi:hypothetical protein
MVRSIFAAARGALVGWGKLERKDTVAPRRGPAVWPVEGTAEEVSG